VRKLIPEDDPTCIRRDAVLLTNKSPYCVRKELNPDSVCLRIFKEKKISAVGYYSHKKLYIYVHCYDMMQQVYKTLPDDRPIMSINVIEDPEKCPSGFAVVSTFLNTATMYCIILSCVTLLKIIPEYFRKVISFFIELQILNIIIIIIIFVFTFMQGITITYLKQTMFIGYIVLQMFCIYSLCYM